MVGWLTALLITLIAISTSYVRQRERLTVPPPGRTQAEAETDANGLVDPEYQALLNSYADAYLISKQVDAGAAQQTALSTVESAIIAYQDRLRTQIDENQFYIQTFLDNYQDTNPELDSLHAKAQVFETEGPKVADELVASTSSMATPIDYGGMITRVVVLILILGVTMAFSVFA